MCVLTLLASGVDAAPRVTLQPLDSPATLPITDTDVARVDNSLILYTPDFGPRTRTNPYGVEVIAVRAGGKQEAARYRVTGLSSVWVCQKPQAPGASTVAPTCGNAPIPSNGIVLSAAGDRRQALLDALRLGSTFTLSEQWSQDSTRRLSITNPTPQSNPLAAGFPGFRGSNQLIRYDAGYGQPTTGTNEFGYEVTVVNGRVSVQEGANSTIPSEPDSFVLSGHGSARAWLLASCPVGAKVSLTPGEPGQTETVRCSIDADTYLSQIDTRIAASNGAGHRPFPDAVKKDIAKTQRTINRLRRSHREDQAAAQAGRLLERVNQAFWDTYTVRFPKGALLGAWHRPVERTEAEVRETLDHLKAAGLNTVFLETYLHGYTIYPSPVHRAFGLAEQHPWMPAGWDPLAVWVKEAHARGMGLHVWFETFYGGSTVVEPPGPILSKYPEWANVQRSAVDDRQVLVTPKPSTVELGHYFLDPANPQVQAFLTQVLDDLVTRYPVDGVQLDYIRYPGSFPPNRYRYVATTWGYSPTARQAFQALSGVDPVAVSNGMTLPTPSPDTQAHWEAWQGYKTQQVSHFVQTAAERMRTRRPGLKVSAAIFPKPEESLLLKHQDWARWAQSGWVDFLAPMTLTSATHVVQEDVTRLSTLTQGKTPVTAGIFGPFHGTPTETVLDQVAAAREGGAAGVVFFDTAHLTGKTLRALGRVLRPAAESP